MKVAIIGGGAAGFFSAIAVKENYPDAQIIIFEKSQNVLSKVKVSGGGRCNLTNGCTDIQELSKAYPRGSRFLKQAFYTFGTKDTMQWFETRGVPLVTQADNCVFPESQKSQSVIDLFLKETTRLGVSIKLGHGVSQLKQKNSLLELHFLSEKKSSELFDKVIIATGGFPKRKNFDWLEKLGHQIEQPVPSLFTFNMPVETITELMGVVVEKSMISIQGTKLYSEGPLLITHWGMSGPAVLKLSAFGARVLSETAYQFKVQVNWVNEKNNDLVLSKLQQIGNQNPRKMLTTIKPFYLPERLWVYLLKKIEIDPTKKWIELGKKSLNKMVQFLTNDVYAVHGKTTFKEEFVTCGGISLKSINHKTMQSKTVDNLYFAGEILDIDGITGGYNFQAAWTTGFIAGKLL